MRSKLALNVLVIFLLGISPGWPQGAGGGPYQILQPKKESLKILPVGAVKPEGWLKAQIAQNLHGFISHLDSLAPDLMVRDDIYGRNRITRTAKPKELGTIIDDEEAKLQLYWWNSETQSNLWDGYIRSVALLDDKTSPEYAKAKAYVARILTYQDPDGYFGIYDKSMRYTFDNENGELWAQTTLLRGLLAWYDYTKDAKVYAAIIRAVDNVMAGYPIGQSEPFKSKNPNVGGTSHGLAFTDVLGRLYQLTGKEKYRAYSVFLYQDFSTQTINEDAQYAKAIRPTVLLQGHGVHLTEHLRSVATAWYASGNPAMQKAFLGLQAKIMANLTPTGAPMGDEWVSGRAPDAEHTGYEYCSIHELLHDYVDLMAKTGDEQYGDRAEHTFFNAAQGARHPTENSIAYLKTDNSYCMAGRRNFDDLQPNQVRYKYSPLHRDAAACCVPNAGRIAPYYIQHMWMENEDGLVATMLGPSTLTTIYKGVQITIRQTTNYPFSDSLRFTVTTSAPIRFTLQIRKPAWAVANAQGLGLGKKKGFVTFTQTWKGKQNLYVQLSRKVQTIKASPKEVFYTYGPLVLARPIASRDSVMKTYAINGYRDLAVLPLDTAHFITSTLASPASSGKGASLTFKVPLQDPASGKEVETTLVPVWGTVLRQVTFKLSKK